MARIKEPNQKIESFLQSAYEFRKNVITGKLEYRFINSREEFKILDDYMLNSIRRELLYRSLKISKSELSDLLNSSFTPRVDVIKAYFKGLRPQNTEIDYIDQLAETVTTTNQSLWKHCFKKWLVASVACAVNPEKVNHQVLVLVGSQGIGKTSWLNGLLPPSLKGYLYAGYINPNNKDTLITLTENMFINLDELGSFRSNDLESLKELVTKSTVQVRRAYAVYADNYIRRASFMGSVNHFHFLSDETGNRRFLPFTVTAVDYKHKIDMDLVFSQAYDLYVRNFKFWFDPEEILEITANNEQYMETSIEQQLIEKNFEVTEETGEYYLGTATDLTKYLKEKSNLTFNNATVQRVGATLRRLGFKRVKSQGVYMYVIKIKDEEPNIYKDQI